MDLIPLAILLAKIVFLTFCVVLPLVPVSVYFERRFCAIIQDRVGPNRTGIPLTLLGFKKDCGILGIGGLVQPVADGIKLFLKEDFTPKYVRTAFYWLAPALTLAPAQLATAIAAPSFLRNMLPFDLATSPARSIRALVRELTSPI